MGPNAAAVIICILTFLSLVIKRFVSSVLMLTTFDLQNLLFGFETWGLEGLGLGGFCMNGFLPSWQNGSFVGGAVLSEMERLPAVHQDDVHGLARRVRVHGRDHLLRRGRAVEGSQSDSLCLLRYLSPSSQEEPSPTPCHRSLGEFLLKLCYKAELFSLCVKKRMCYRGTWQLSLTSCTMVR